jgi:hypothetical protein
MSIDELAQEEWAKLDPVLHMISFMNMRRIVARSFSLGIKTASEECVQPTIEPDTASGRGEDSLAMLEADASLAMQNIRRVSPDDR